MTFPIELQQVSEHSLAAIDKQLVSNVGAILLDDFIVMVDAGMRPDAARLLRETLEDRHHRPVRYLCVTHYHADHTFSLSPFKDVSLFASQQIVENMKNSPDWTPQGKPAWKDVDPADRLWLNQVEMIYPSVLFQHRMDITNHDQHVEFRHAGGHTSCSVYGWYPAEKVLFAGDLVFAGRFPYAGDGTCDPEAWIAALREWLSWDIDYVIPGHGPVSGAGEINRQLEFLEAFKENTLEAVRSRQEPREIKLPDMYPVDRPGFVESARKRWFEYYKKREERA
jgi:glyoxylase-like metal-dependent hydrolase (beta-lactamase superfamily II)